MQLLRLHKILEPWWEVCCPKDSRYLHHHLWSDWEGLQVSCLRNLDKQLTLRFLRRCGRLCIDELGQVDPCLRHQGFGPRHLQRSGCWSSRPLLRGHHRPHTSPTFFPVSTSSECVACCHSFPSPWPSIQLPKQKNPLSRKTPPAALPKEAASSVGPSDGGVEMTGVLSLTSSVSTSTSSWACSTDSSDGVAQSGHTQRYLPFSLRMQWPQSSLLHFPHSLAMGFLEQTWQTLLFAQSQTEKDFGWASLGSGLHSPSLPLSLLFPFALPSPWGLHPFVASYWRYHPRPQTSFAGVPRGAARPTCSEP